MSQDLERFVFAYLRRRVEQGGKRLRADALRKHVAAERLPTPSPKLARFELRFRRGDVSLELNALDGEAMSWTWPELQKPPGGPLDEAQALALATQTAQPPAGASLASAGFEKLDGRQVFVARWEHREGDLLVEGDHIQVMIGPSGRVFAHHRRWHDVDLTPTAR